MRDFDTLEMSLSVTASACVGGVWICGMEVDKAGGLIWYGFKGFANVRCLFVVVCVAAITFLKHFTCKHATLVGQVR